MSSLLNEADKFGCTPLHYASKQGFIKTIVNLLKMGAQVTIKSNKQQSALHFAARFVSSKLQYSKDLAFNDKFNLMLFWYFVIYLLLTITLSGEISLEKLSRII